MSRHQQEYVDALLDGELQGWRRYTVVRHLRGCPVCAMEYRKQRHVRRLLRANPPQVTMDDSAEFFWAKVKAEIGRRGDEVVATPEPRLSLGDWLFQHQAALASVTALLVVALAGVWALRSNRPTTVTPAQPLAVVEHATTALHDTVATPFQSKAAGVTVITRG